MSREYIKDISRIGYSFLDISAWFKGESEELKKILDFGFDNTLFVVENKTVTTYYDNEECARFYLILDEKLTEDFFNKLCDSFFELIEDSKRVQGDKERFDLIVKCWPVLTIFHEISNYPEYANERMIARLSHIRKSKESFIWDLSKGLDFRENIPQNYLFFKGKIINCSFDEFCKENGIVIKNG